MDEVFVLSHWPDSNRGYFHLAIEHLCSSRSRSKSLLASSYLPCVRHSTYASDNFFTPQILRTSSFFALYRKF